MTEIANEVLELTNQLKEKREAAIVNLLESKQTKLDEISQIEEALSQLGYQPPKKGAKKGTTRHLSPEGRAKISAAAKARHARTRAAKASAATQGA